MDEEDSGLCYMTGFDIVTYLLKARTVEQDKQPLLVNDLKRHLFLGNSREIDNRTASVARLKILKKQE
jgi:hypothetical protein